MVGFKILMGIIFLILLVFFCVKIAIKNNQSKLMWALLVIIPYYLFFVHNNLLWLLRALEILSFSSERNFSYFIVIALLVSFVYILCKLEPWKIVLKPLKNFLQQSFKQCPYCNGIISTGAKKCKHCSEWLVVE